MDDIDNLKEMLKGLGKTHKDKGILPEHYPVVGKGLILTLQAGLKTKFTPEAKIAWETIFNMVADMMISTNYDEVEGDETMIMQELDDPDAGKLTPQRISLIR